MVKRLIGAALVLLLVVPAIGSAMDMSGKYALGYFHSDAPVGIRYWLQPNLGIDLGFGFEAKDVTVGNDKETATSFWIDAGLPYVIMDTERANFFVRPGFMLSILDDRTYDPEGFTATSYDETWTNMAITLTPGAEVFFGNNFSLEAGHGVKVNIMSPPDQVSDQSYTTISTFDASVTYLGFHFYFK